MAKPHRMFLVTLTALYLGLTPRTWQPLLDGAPAHGLAAACLTVVAVGCIITMWRRLARIARRLRQPAPCSHIVSYIATMFAVGLTGWMLWHGPQIQRASR